MTRLSVREDNGSHDTSGTSSTSSSSSASRIILKAKHSGPSEVEMQPLTAIDDPSSVDKNRNNYDLPIDETALKLHAATADFIPVVSFWDAYLGKESWATALDHFLFPPNLPRPCQLLRPENIAIPACYLLVGLLQGFSSVMIGVFPLDLGATEAQQTTLRSLRGLPASFKLVFGFWRYVNDLCLQKVVFIALVLENFSCWL